jgi:hypothetical protein
MSAGSSWRVATILSLSCKASAKQTRRRTSEAALPPLPPLTRPASQIS